jgi:mono/diheme cytochrome c family protein
MKHRAQHSGAKILPRFAVGLVALLAGGCPNMDRQSNYRPLEPAPFFKNQTTARAIPAFTVARDSARAEAAVSAARVNGALVQDVPVPVTLGLLQRGRERFTIYCAVCHGADGYGDGIIVRRGFPRPPSYHDHRLLDAPAGHFFEVITNGYGAMYSYADRVAPEDRWAIVAYIRALQLSRHASIDDVPPSERAHLEAQP